MQNKVVLKNIGMGYVKMHGSTATPYMIFENGGRVTNSILSRALLT